MDQGDLQSFQVQPGGFVVLVGEHDLEEGRVRGAVLGLEPLDQVVEGHVLVLQVVQGPFPDLPEQLAEGEITVHVGAQHDRIHEHADHPLQLGVPPVRHGAPHHDVAVARAAGQEHGEQGLQQRERSGVLAVAQRPQFLGERRRQ